MSKAKPFQLLTAEKAFSVLAPGITTKPDEMPRFLVADEVGLGKTIVAKEVIRRLCEVKPSLTVIYFTSNQEIARQNYPKLFPESDSGSGSGHVGRLTLYPFKNNEEETGTASRGLRILGFTPATSLDLRSSMGLGEERAHIARLMLLFFSETEKNESTVQVLARRRPLISAYFKGAVRRENWKSKNLFDVEKIEKLSSIYSDQDSFIKEHLSPLFRNKKTFISETFAHIERSFHQKDALEYIGDWETRRELFNELYRKKGSREFRLFVIKRCREAVALATLKSLAPDLLVLDEFHKFSDLLYENEKQTASGHVASNELADELLQERKYPILFLSATPYRIFRGSENNIDQRHKTFTELCGMLWGKAGKQNGGQIDLELKEYQNALKGDDPHAVSVAKLKIEGRLSGIISRTERGEFEPIDSIEDRFLDGMPVEDPGSKAEHDESIRLAQIRHFKDFFSLSKKVGAGHSINVTHWKSGQFIESFCERYKWFKACGLEEAELPSRGPIEVRNPKMAYLRKLCEGMEKELWLPPSSMFQSLKESTEGTPSLEAFYFLRKVLVFSSWEFVPRMVSECLFDPPGKGKDRVFTPRVSSLLFLRNVEWSQSVDNTILKMISEVRSIKNKEYEEILDSHRNPQGGQSTYGIPLDAPSLPANAIFNAIEKYFSPKVKSRKPGQQDQLISASAAMCLGAVRPYFLNPFRVRIIEDAFAKEVGTEETGDETIRYAKKMMHYLQTRHFSLVMDEYLYALSEKWDPENEDSLVTDVLTPFFKALLIKPGHGGHRIALNFNGEGIEEDGAGESGATRQSSLRHAFNSPFHPFVLATTSVGQEGLDFHTYCQDIVHWDIPNSPEDLEQREGRIRRFRGVAQRRAVFWDYLNRNKSDKKDVDWNRVFKRAAQPDFLEGLTRSSTDENRFRDLFNWGLHPDWIYVGSTGSDHLRKTRRHVMAYPFSKDAERYRNLIRRLVYYRMALGQNRPQEFLASVEVTFKRLGKDPEQEKDWLRERAISLRPRPKGAILKVIRGFFRDMTEEDCMQWWKALIPAMEAWIQKAESAPQQWDLEDRTTMAEIKIFFSNCRDAVLDPRVKDFREKLVLMYYLASPYDLIDDGISPDGLQDDFAQASWFFKRRNWSNGS